MHAQSALKLAFFHAILPEPGRKPGGVELFVHRLANRLVEREHDVTCFSFGFRPPDANYRVVSLGATWLATRRAARLTIAPLLVNRIEQSAFDVVHLHGDDWFLLRRRVATVRTFYGSALLEARSATRLRRSVSQTSVFPLELIASRLATASYDIGSPLPRGYRTRGSLALAVDAVADGSPPARSERPTILFVGMWDGRKRGSFLADVFERHVLTRHPAAELLMVSERCDERPGIRWMGVPSDATLADLYRSAWVFCLPSTYEGFGLPYLEACVHGLPVVATPNPGAAHVLSAGAGLIVDDRDLGDTLCRLLADPEARRRMGVAATERARDFAWSRVLDEHEAAYAYAIAHFTA